MMAALYDLHGTQHPICAIIANKHDVLNIVDLPPMFGPVNNIIGLLKLISLATKSIEYNAGCIPSTTSYPYSTNTGLDVFFCFEYTAIAQQQSISANMLIYLSQIFCFCLNCSKKNVTNIPICVFIPFQTIYNSFTIYWIYGTRYLL